MEIQHSAEELRAESSLLKGYLDAQSKELSQRKHRMEELEEKERQENDNVEGLMIDIVAAEEEITRWKVAAEQEGAAARAVEQEYLSQLCLRSMMMNSGKEFHQSSLENCLLFKML